MFGSLKDIVPIVEQLTRLPGRALVEVAALLSGSLTVLGIFVARGGGFLPWLPLLVGILGLIACVIFGMRRHQLEKAVEQWKKNQATTLDSDSTTTNVDYSRMYAGEAPSSSRDVVVINEDGTTSTGTPHQDSAHHKSAQFQRRREAMLEETQRRDTWMPRIEAAQRAAIVAAGGLVNAPYLKADLRITLASAFATLASVPLSIFFIIVALLSLL